MVDPISIVSLVTTLLDIGVRLTSQTRILAGSYRDAPGSIRAVWGELTSLCAILGRIEGMLKGNTTSRSPFTGETMVDLRVLLDHTMKIFMEFQAFVNEFSEKGGSTLATGGYQQLQWVLAEKHIMAFRDALETHKASLSITLQLGTLLATANIANVVRKVHANTETTNAELARLRAMCQKLLDREGIVDGDGFGDEEDPFLDTSSNESSFIPPYPECTGKPPVEEVIPEPGSSNPTHASEFDAIFSGRTSTILPNVSLPGPKSSSATASVPAPQVGPLLHRLKDPMELLVDGARAGGGRMVWNRLSTSTDSKELDTARNEETRYNHRGVVWDLFGHGVDANSASRTRVTTHQVAGWASRDLHREKIMPFPRRGDVRRRLIRTVLLR